VLPYVVILSVAKDPCILSLPFLFVIPEGDLLFAFLHTPKAALLPP
jgi:hypothetical protein